MFRIFTRSHRRKFKPLRRKRDERRKSAHDPLTSITKQLASTSSSSSSRQAASWNSRSQQPRASTSTFASTSTPKDPTQARISRESSERQRALALIEKRKRERAGNDTPSTVCGGAGYSDQFNREDVRAAHERYERERGERTWDGGYVSRDQERRGWDAERRPSSSRNSHDRTRRATSESSRARYS